VAKLEGKVYVMGTPGLVEELDKENIQHIGSGVRNPKKPSLKISFAYMLTTNACIKGPFVFPPLEKRKSQLQF
jgi:hypothetical protein